MIVFQLAEGFEDRDDVVVAKMDSTINELEHTKVTSFPTIKLYAKGDNKVSTHSKKNSHSFECLKCLLNVRNDVKFLYTNNQILLAKYLGEPY